jgi:hypothetical protein
MKVKVEFKSMGKKIVMRYAYVSCLKIFQPNHQTLHQSFSSIKE